MSSSDKCTENGKEIPCSELIDKQKDELKKAGETVAKGVAYGFTALAVLIVFVLLSSLGAARLAYLRSGNIIFAILAFFFSFLYYPWYAWTQPSTMIGAARYLRKMW
jgi:hypothetical protein